MRHFTSFPKSQLNSEWIYEDINFPKYKSKNLKDFALKVFIASFGLLEASQGSYKNFQGKILQIVWFVFWNIDDFINSFWLNLTFMRILQYFQYLKNYSHEQRPLLQDFVFSCIGIQYNAHPLLYEGILRIT